MATINVKRQRVHGTTAEGANAAPMTKEQALRRSVMSCLLWEDEFYEDGAKIADRIGALVLDRDIEVMTVLDMAIEAREKAKLRHVPLLLLAYAAQRARGFEIAKGWNCNGYAMALERVIQRADELTEFLAIYAKINGVTPDKIKNKLFAQVKKGIAAAFNKFDAYQLAKYIGQVGEKGQAIKARDAMFLCHPKPMNEAQALLWKQAIAYELAIPDTWETALSAGADKCETFTRLIKERKLGYLALLRNLRNMIGAEVDSTLVTDAITARKGAWRVLPFRYVAAARAAPQFEPALDAALCEAIAEMPIMPGSTAVLCDVSGSMDERLSGKSDLTRIDAAAILAAIIPGNVRMFSFSDRLVEVPARRGMAGVDAIKASQPHHSTRLIEAVRGINESVKYDRLIVISDEQAHPSSSYGNALPDPLTRGYMINVASNQRGIGYDKWTHIDGFSENVIRFIREHEGLREPDQVQLDDSGSVGVE